MGFVINLASISSCEGSILDKKRNMSRCHFELYCSGIMFIEDNV